MVKNPPAMQETQVQFPDQEDPLEEGTATHSGILAWRVPWTEEPGGLWSIGSHRVGHNSARMHRRETQKGAVKISGVSVFFLNHLIWKKTTQVFNLSIT